MRLIDEAVLLDKHAEQCGEKCCDTCRFIGKEKCASYMAITETPTAFDIEAVVKELEDAKKTANEETFGRRNGKSALFGFIHGINLAIRVIKWNARFGNNPDVNEIAKWLCGSIRKGGVK